ncbi:hypothetical protein JQ617_08350 [Bradyrhizobium sp. KB893862 SZCCT0404]|uniref:hypothetical protein n=1 Tax=Bradyrhizobium sp. KB893862 SZCCT0404 TaxID=2807672 RepID=UPI001BAAE1D7|nr:hypothetical protein [Bradyrhizobium sp. KB893862 SZCCT0404]MBR1173960.1 hypothetical protein [Bradyrhizobium sp. KB893862 SZCCT0404]
MTTRRARRILLLPLALAATLSVASAAELNPAAVTYKLPDQIPWGPVDARGAQTAVVVGELTEHHRLSYYNQLSQSCSGNTLPSR